jgi:hypothetical protein
MWQMGIKTKIKQINAIYRRLGLNNDAKISFSDFAQCLKPSDIYKVQESQLKAIARPNLQEFSPDPMMGKSPRRDSLARTSLSPMKRRKSAPTSVVKNSKNQYARQTRIRQLRDYSKIARSNSPHKEEFTSPIKRYGGGET